ncbi:MAG: hypothetical protein Q8S09_01815 [Hyphomonas sp.]|nr:hypothetical protein [Hyphomonas sp.]
MNRQKLDIPNGLSRNYQSLRVQVCHPCNTVRFSQLETRVAMLLRSSDPYTDSWSAGTEDIALWLAKIIWLLARKASVSLDPLHPNGVNRDTIIPQELLANLEIAKVMIHLHAHEHSLLACREKDPPFPEFFYGAPYSLYRFKVRPQSEEDHFDFTDNYLGQLAAVRSGNLGIICIFDGGLHASYLSDQYADYVGPELHPIQWREIIGRIICDQTVIEPELFGVQHYYWNKKINSAVAALKCPRFISPYNRENVDDDLFVEVLRRQTGQQIEKFSDGPQTRFGTFLRTQDGKVRDFFQETDV